MKKAVSVINAVSILVLFLVISIFLPTFNMGFYEKEYDKLNIAQSIGVSDEDLMRVTKHLTKYMVGFEKDLVVVANVGGVDREFFNDREKAHMVDVKNLFLFARNALIVAILALVYSVIHLKDPIIIAKANLRCQIGFLAILIILTAIISRDFYNSFTVFHEIFFRNDLWQLNPETDLLLNIVPLQFFIDISTLVAINFGTFMITTIICSVSVLKKA